MTGVRAGNVGYSNMEGWEVPESHNNLQSDMVQDTLSQSKDYIHYGDLNFNQNGQFLGASNPVNYGPAIPNLDLNR
jgi:hypothetical protein